MAGTLVIRVDAGPTMGAGHWMRSQAVADAWRAAGGRTVVVSHKPARWQRLGAPSSGHAIHPLRSPHPHPNDAAETARVVRQATSTDGSPPWLLLDGYHFDGHFAQSVREATGCRLAAVDDIGQWHGGPVELVVNPHPAAEAILTSQVPSASSGNGSAAAGVGRAVGSGGRLPAANAGADAPDHRPHLLLGPQYALIRRPFRDARRATRSLPQVARRVLVTFGGADPDNITSLAVRALGQIRLPGLEARVVVGPANRHGKAIRTAARGANCRIQVVRQLADMPRLMRWADVALAAAGSTCWEMAFLGLPAAVVAIADNQVRLARELARKGVVLDLGPPHCLSCSGLAESVEQLCCDPRLRAAQSRAGRRLVDGRGAERVAETLALWDHPSPAAELRLRPARETDRLPVWHLANEPSVRAMSRRPDPIPFSTHREWFGQRLASPGTRIWIAEYHGLLLGQIRYDLVEPDTAEVSLAVSPAFRRRGLGTRLLAQTWQTAQDQLGVQRLLALVRHDNQASNALFTRAGFAPTGVRRHRGHDWSVMLFPAGS